MHGARHMEHGVIRRREHGDWRTHHQTSCRDTRMTMAVLYLLQLYTPVWRALGSTSRFGTSGLRDSNVITMSCYRECSFGSPFFVSICCHSNKLNHLATGYTHQHTALNTNVTASGSDQRWSSFQNPSIYSINRCRALQEFVIRQPMLLSFQSCARCSGYGAPQPSRTLHMAGKSQTD